MGPAANRPADGKANRPVTIPRFRTGSYTITTDAGDTSHLRRFIDINTAVSVKNGPGGPGYGNPQGQADPFYYYKIVANDPYNNDFSVTIDVAQGGFTYATAFKFASPNAYVMAEGENMPATSSATATNGKTPVTQYTGSSPFTMSRGSDFFVQATLYNGVGYFSVNTPLSALVDYQGSVNDIDITAEGESRYEVVPFAITNGP